MSSKAYQQNIAWFILLSCSCFQVITFTNHYTASCSPSPKTFSFVSYEISKWDKVCHLISFILPLWVGIIQLIATNELKWLIIPWQKENKKDWYHRLEYFFWRSISVRPSENSISSSKNLKQFLIQHFCAANSLIKSYFKTCFNKRAIDVR